MPQCCASSTPADYEVSATPAGFSTTTTKLTLTVGAQHELRLALKVGEITQLVEITGVAPVIETENAALSGNVQSAQIVELPLNGRDWTSLAVPGPGVVHVRPHEPVSTRRQFARPWKSNDDRQVHSHGSMKEKLRRATGCGSPAAAQTTGLLRI
jgi:hypothetical protein